MTEKTIKSTAIDPSGHTGPIEHGPPISDEGARRLILSAVWGGQPATVTSENGADVTPWNPDCSWYQYGIEYGLNGCQHPGMDIGISWGTRLYAAEGGQVVYAGPDQYYAPQHVNVETGAGEVHIYGHMSSVDPQVSVGGQVQAGQYLGESGGQNGDHLHFERRVPNSDCNSGFCSEDPESILANAPIDGKPPFQDDDRIAVVDGPLQLREHGNLQAKVLGSLAEGTAMVVTGGPVRHDGHIWYRVRLVEGAGTGWVAAEYCRLAS
jgi:murein DD-endopeptidase MepM/ murein hydrolase activator NlpD